MQVARDKLGASTGSGVSSLYTVQSLCTSCYVHCTLVAAVWSWAVVWAHLFLRLSPQLQASCRKSEENRSMRGKASNKAGCGKGVIARIFFSSRACHPCPARIDVLYLLNSVGSWSNLSSCMWVHQIFVEYKHSLSWAPFNLNERS